MTGKKQTTKLVAPQPKGYSFGVSQTPPESRRRHTARGGRVGLPGAITIAISDASAKSAPVQSSVEAGASGRNSR